MSKKFDKMRMALKDWSEGGELPYAKLPAYSSAMSCLKECTMRFGKKMPTAFRPMARDIKSHLSRILVLMVHAKLCLSTKESLREATDLAIAVQVGIRVLSDLHAISLKDYEQISKHSNELVSQLVGWSRSCGVWNTDSLKDVEGESSSEQVVSNSDMQND